MTIFSKIIKKEIPAKIVYEDDLCIAIHDIAPQAPIHILVIPKKPIPSMMHVETNDKNILGHLMFIASQIARDHELTNGYRLAVNTGKDGGQTIDHLHIHILGKRVMKESMG